METVPSLPRPLGLSPVSPYLQLVFGVRVGEWLQTPIPGALRAQAVACDGPLPSAVRPRVCGPGVIRWRRFEVRVVIAPDSFKGCLSALQVCDAVERGVLRAVPDAQTVKAPMADGGEGTVDALVDATGGRYVTERVVGPLGVPTQARFGVLGDSQTAVIEMAAASGLPLVPPARRNPLLTTTFGTGQLIKAALDLGCRKFIIGIGGSATNDAGAGMAQALGARMVDAHGAEIVRASGGRLADIAHIDVSQLDDRLSECEVRVACDVDNPLYGETGAAHVYGLQKGATPEIVAMLDAGLRHFADLLKKDLGVDVADVPGAGAAGGLGAGLIAFCHATLERGVDIVIDVVRLDERMRGADLVITGEGRIDRQTSRGKTPHGVARVAGDNGIPVVALGGSVDITAHDLHDAGFHAVFSILTEPMTLDEAMMPARAEAMLAFAGEQVLRAIGSPAGRNVGGE